jgi:hypothetical protein
MGLFSPSPSKVVDRFKKLYPDLPTLKKIRETQKERYVQIGSQLRDLVTDSAEALKDLKLSDGQIDDLVKVIKTCRRYRELFY